MGRDADRILRIPGARWVSDSDVTHCANSKCPKAAEAFGLLRRRHHCRDCGKVYCDVCAPTRPTLGYRRCSECFLPMCFIPVRFPVFVRRAAPAPGAAAATSSAAAALLAAGLNDENPFEEENRRMRGVAGYFQLGGFSGAVVDNIMSFMDFKELNALLQTCKRAQSRFHVRGLRYEAQITDRFPSYWNMARIGDGGGGVVFKVRDPKCASDKDQFVALKVVKKNVQYGFAVWKRLRTEIDLQKDISHPHIAKLLDVFQTPDEVVLVIEAGDGGSLRKVFEVLRSNHNQISWFTATVLKGCAEALIYLRGLNIAHRDIKCDNVVFSEDFSRVMMIDFGLAERVVSDRQAFTPCLSKNMELLTDRGWVDYDTAKKLWASKELVVAGYGHRDLARKLSDKEHEHIIYETPVSFTDNPDDNDMYMIATKEEEGAHLLLHIEVTGNHGVIIQDTDDGDDDDDDDESAHRAVFQYVEARDLAAGKWRGMLNESVMDSAHKRKVLTSAAGGVGFAEGDDGGGGSSGDLETLFPGGKAALEAMLPVLQILRQKSAAGQEDARGVVRGRDDFPTINNNRPLGTPLMGLKDGDATTTKKRNDNSSNDQAAAASCIDVPDSSDVIGDGEVLDVPSLDGELDDDQVNSLPVAEACEYAKRKFLFFLGLWLGNGSLTLGARPGVSVALASASDIQRMQGLMKLFGLTLRTVATKGGDYYFHKETTSEQVVLVIERPSWVNFFFSNWGYKSLCNNNIALCDPQQEHVHETAKRMYEQCMEPAMASAAEFAQVRLSDVDGHDLKQYWERVLAAVCDRETSRSVMWLRRWMLRLGLVYARELLWGLAAADGKNGDDELAVVRTKSAAFRDQVMHLAVICGYSTQARKMIKSDCWGVNFCDPQNNSGASICKDDVRKMEGYTGGSWCVAMPHGNIIVRRKQTTTTAGLPLDMLPCAQIIKNCGTVGFASPENIAAVAERRSKFHANMDVMSKADMFSLGVVAFMMLSSTKPFKGSRFPEMHREVQAGLRCEGRGWGHVSSAAKALVEKMMRADPATRTSPEEVLEDPWIEEGCRRFKEVVERRKEELAKQRNQERDDWVMPSFERVSKSSPSSKAKAQGGSGAAGELPQEGASEGCWLFEGEVVQGGEFRPVA